MVTDHEQVAAKLRALAQKRPHGATSATNHRVALTVGAKAVRELYCAAPVDARTRQSYQAAADMEFSADLIRVMQAHIEACERAMRDAARLLSPPADPDDYEPEPQERTVEEEVYREPGGDSPAYRRDMIESGHGRAVR